MLLEDVTENDKEDEAEVEGQVETLNVWVVVFEAEAQRVSEVVAEGLGVVLGE